MKVLKLKAKEPILIGRDDNPNLAMLAIDVAGFTAIDIFNESNVFNSVRVGEGASQVRFNHIHTLAGYQMLLDSDAEPNVEIWGFSSGSSPLVRFKVPVRIEADLSAVERFKVPRLSSAPTDPAPEDGEIYYNTTDNNFYGRANGSWVQLNN